MRDIAGTLPEGVGGAMCDDEFGGSYGSVYGFTGNGFTERELLDYLRRNTSILDTLRDTNVLDDDTAAELAKKTDEFARGMAMGGTLFEELGFYYVGPIDGHNLDQLIPVLENVRDAAEGPPRRAPRLVFVQPERHLLCGQQVQVCLDLFRQPLVPTTAQDEIEGSREEYPDAGHDSPSRRRLTMETVRAQSSVSDASWRRPEAVIE